MFVCVRLAEKLAEEEEKRRFEVEEEERRRREEEERVKQLQQQEQDVELQSVRDVSFCRFILSIGSSLCHFTFRLSLHSLRPILGWRFDLVGDCRKFHSGNWFL